MADTAHEQLKKALEEGEQWAIRLWFEYFYGKPKQTTDINMTGDVNIDPKEFT